MQQDYVIMRESCMRIVILSSHYHIALRVCNVIVIVFVYGKNKRENDPLQLSTKK